MLKCSALDVPGKFREGVAMMRWAMTWLAVVQPASPRLSLPQRAHVCLLVSTSVQYHARVEPMLDLRIQVCGLMQLQLRNFTSSHLHANVSKSAQLVTYG